MASIVSAGTTSGTSLNLSADTSGVLQLATNGTGTSGLPTLGLADAVINVSGTGYRLAQASLPASVTLSARRVGDTAATGTLNIANSAINDGYSEKLVGTIGAAPAGFTVSAPATTGLIAAGGSESRTVSLSTATAGTFGGNVNIALASDGTGTSGFGALSIGSADVALSGKVYTPAVAQLNTAVISFGIVRKGDVVGSQSVEVKNNAGSTPLNDTMAASMGAVSSGFTSSGGVSGLGAGASGSGTLIVGLDTAAAGIFNGSATVDFLSQNGDMTDLALAGLHVALSGQVNDIAKPLFNKTGGAGSFGCVGQVCTLDFGNLLVGSGISSNTLALTNDVSGPAADDLLGGFNLAFLGLFVDSGFGTVNLAPGGSLGPLMLSFDALNEGLFSGSFLFSGLSHYAGLTDLVLDDITVNLRANVVRQGAAPEPGTIAMILLAAGIALGARRRQQRMH